MINIDNLLISSSNSIENQGEVSGEGFSNLLLELNAERGFELSQQDISKMAALLGKSDADLEALSSKEAALLNQAVEKISTINQDSQELNANRKNAGAVEIREIEQGQAKLLSSVVLSSDLVSAAKQVVESKNVPVVEQGVESTPISNVVASAFSNKEGGFGVQSRHSLNIFDSENMVQLDADRSNMVPNASLKEIVARSSEMLASDKEQQSLVGGADLKQVEHLNLKATEQSDLQIKTQLQKVGSLTINGLVAGDVSSDSVPLNMVATDTTFSPSGVIVEQSAPVKTLTIEQLNSKVLDAPHPSAPVFSIGESVNNTLSMNSDVQSTVVEPSVNVSIKNEGVISDQQAFKVNEQLNFVSSSPTAKAVAPSSDALTLVNIPEENLKFDIVSNAKQESDVEKLDAPRLEQAVKANPGKMETKLAELGLLVRQTALSNIKQITIQLKPVELGSVDVTVREVAGELMVKFVTEKPETAELLQRQESNLKQSLLNGDVAEMSYGDGENQQKHVFTSKNFEKSDEPLVVETPKQAESVEQGRLRITV